MNAFNRVFSVVALIVLLVTGVLTLLAPAVITGGSVVFHDADGDDIDVNALGVEQMRRFRWDKVSMVFQGAMNALNPVATIGSQLEDVFEVLAKKDVREPTNWSRRFKNHQEKLKSGDVYQVAEVVRNLALRDADKGLSAGEKSMFVKARQVLVSELAFALNISEDTALDRLNKTLA